MIRSRYLEQQKAIDTMVFYFPSFTGLGEPHFVAHVL
jgi:hypothetical protein